MPARRGPPTRRPRRASTRGGRAEAAWREFAASFARAGMVPPAEAGLAAVEAAEGAAVLLLAPRQVSGDQPGRSLLVVAAAASASPPFPLRRR